MCIQSITLTLVNNLNHLSLLRGSQAVTDSLTPRSRMDSALRQIGSSRLLAPALVASMIVATGACASLHATLQSASVPDARTPGGSIMVVGGGWVTPDIRRKFVELAGGVNAKIVLIPAVDLTPEGVQTLLAPWRSIGAFSVRLIHAPSRDAANSPEFCSPLRDATGVWFGGGYQSLLAQRYVDTLVQKCLHEVLQRQGVVGGCSAGAALLSRVMIREGENIPIEAKGLNLLNNVIVDQHFLARNRLWRLEQILKTHPNHVGLGVDEATALVIHAQSWKLQVVGESYVFVCLPPGDQGSARIEILKTGDAVSLAELRQEHLAFIAPAE